MRADAGFEPVIRHEVAETSTLVTFVAAGLGVAIVPEPVSELVVTGTIYRPLSSRTQADHGVVHRGAPVPGVHDQVYVAPGARP